MFRLGCLMMLAFVAAPLTAAAQDDEARVQIAVHVSATASGEFDNGDAGLGARLSSLVTPLVGADVELTFYPADYPQPPAFSRSRLEGLFGVTAGPRIGRLRPFAKVRPGFVRFNEAPEPLACIAIFPPPLACTLADGRTVMAIDIGGGLEWFPSGRTTVRVDAGDRLLRYPGPVIDTEGTVRDEAFFGHDVRLTMGVGFRF